MKHSLSVVSSTQSFSFLSDLTGRFSFVLYVYNVLVNG